MSLLIQKSGILDTVQDLGRTGFRRFGINPNGVMDPTAVRLINILIGNPEPEGVLEFHFPAPGIKFESDTVFALGGADFSASLDGEPVQNWRPFLARKNSLLTFKHRLSGSRAYLAVKGGFKVEKWLGSVSTHLAAALGGFEGRRLKTGDRIFFRSHVAAPPDDNYSISPSIIPKYSRFPTVHITAGAEYELLNALGEETLIKENFSVSSRSDRMGFRLKGKPIFLNEQIELVSSAGGFGTIQLLPDGQLIVLMADHQTSGGYPRIGHVASVDLPLLGQLGPGDKVAFHLISLAEAEELTVRFERDLNLLKVACGFLK
jgi:antagonist of KipI